MGLGGAEKRKGTRIPIEELKLDRDTAWADIAKGIRRLAEERAGEEQQKLCIARLLPVKPAVLLMDERGGWGLWRTGRAAP